MVAAQRLAVQPPGEEHAGTKERWEAINEPKWPRFGGSGCNGRLDGTHDSRFVCTPLSWTIDTEYLSSHI